MSVLNQKTIKKNISLEGVGLHSGIISKIIINPAEPNTGIIFKRIDIAKEQEKKGESKSENKPVENKPVEKPLTKEEIRQARLAFYKQN